MGKAFESIKAGLQQAIAHGKGEQAGAVVKVYRQQFVDIKEMRRVFGKSRQRRHKL